MPDLASSLEGRYRLDELIGRGGMADVYRGHDLRLDRDVAVKVLREVEHGRRFEVEVHTLATLDHPNLVRLLDAGSDGGDRFLVMELLGGASVLELVGGAPVEPERVRTIGREACAGLADIHARGIVHRDVKPSNLMFDEHGTLRIADFGIVHLVDGTTLTGTHQTIGTMAYLAPEQLRGQAITPAADVYALGLVLLECLTGQRAFVGTPAEAAAARLHHDPEVPESLPAPWPELLRAMTAREPSDRPSAREVRDHLGAPARAPETPVEATAVLPAAAVDDAMRTVPIDAPVDEPNRQPRSRRLVLAALLAAIVVATVAGVWAATRDDSALTPVVATTTTAVPTTSAPPSPSAAVATTRPPTTTSPPVVVDGGAKGKSGRGEGSRRGPGGKSPKGRGGKKGDG